MKNFLALLILLSSVSSYAQVKIVSDYNRYEYFPSRWLRSAVNASAEPVSKEDEKRARVAIKNFISKYPKSVLDKNLDGIYLVSKFRFYNNNNLRFGATYHKKRIFIRYKTSEGDSIKFTERHLHHEFSSILLERNYFPKRSWKNNNKLSYSSKRGGVDCLNNPGDGRDEHTRLFSVGFLTTYGACDYEDDINIYAEYIFLFPRRLEKIENKYPRVKKKAKIIRGFYCKINNKFHFCKG
mgnify:CR=1 FL=1